MKRREFIQIAAITGATAALAGCGHPEHQLIRFVPEEDLEPGMAEWKPSICPACSAGCGILARVMEGEAEVVRGNQLGLINMGLVKKLEGNPAHPISRGKLCPRGQAAIQITYHPDRITDPLRRTGPRGSGQFQKITWEEGVQEMTAKIQELIKAQDASRLAFLTRPLGGQASRLVELFLASLGAPPAVAFEVFDEAVSRRANELSFGHAQLPTFDLGNANYLISFGADFLGTWNSPVAHAGAYGEMRQGRPGVRGKFVQVEPRMSATGANADEWIPARPGTEGILALGLAHVILSEKLRPTRAASDAQNLVEGWSRSLPDYTPEEVQKKTGVAATTVERLAREMATHSPALAIIGGAPLAQTNGLFNALAVNALNTLLGSVLKPGGIFFTPKLPTGATASTQKATSIHALAERITSSEAGGIKVLLLYDANPVFGTPPGWRVRDALEKTPFLVSFGGFLDETSILADLILPEHSFLESWVEHVPESGTTQAVESLAPPAMRPLHNTRSMPDVLLAVAHRLGGRVAAALEWETFDAMLRESFAALSKPGAGGSKEQQISWEKAQKQGGWWSAPANPPRFALRTTRVRAPRSREPEWDGSPQQFPFHFLPYASQSFLDGSLAHLPWLQELPDVLATAMWGTWVEINPQTAERLRIQQGDVVEVASQHGKLRAPALLSPGIAPDVLAMPVGQGHRNFTRYARGRGANPLEILAPLVEPETGALAWAATRVRISRVGQGRLVLFGGGLRESPTERRHR